MNPEASKLLQVFPVSIWQLGQEIDRIADENHWDVLAVSVPPVERGPLRIEGVDLETGETFWWDRYQLYAYVDLEDVS
jgi:hypothetical protein